MKKNNNFEYKEYAIESKEQVSPDMFTFRFKEKFSFAPGQFVQVAMDHYGEATFAPCSDSEAKSGFEICVRGCGNTTNQMVKLMPGDKLKIRGPYGNSWPIHKMLGKNVLLIAGGMGLIPLRPLIINLIRYKSEFKDLYLLAGFKTDQIVLFEEDLKLWQKKFHYQTLVAEHTSGKPGFEQGLITAPLEKIAVDPKKTIVVMCGPEIMFKFCFEVLEKKGFADENIYISFERRMECGIGICQHCSIGKYLVCKDGPVFSYAQIKPELGK